MLIWTAKFSRKKAVAAVIAMGVVMAALIILMGRMPGDETAEPPYFDALRDIGYAGGVSCECGWGDRKDFAKNLETALATMKRLAGQA